MIQLRAATVLTDVGHYPERLVDEKEISAITGFSRRTFQNWRGRRSGPPFVRVGRVVRYEISAVMRWMRRNGHRDEAS